MREKLADPEYMAKAIDVLADDITSYLMPQTEPEIENDGRVRCPKYDS